MENSVDIDPVEAARLTFLRRLVTVLTLVMIGGFIIMIATFVTRFPKIAGETSSIPFNFPENIVLPDGTDVFAFTRGTDWVAIISADDQILIFDAETGKLRQEIAIKSE